MSKANIPIFAPFPVIRGIQGQEVDKRKNGVWGKASAGRLATRYKSNEKSPLPAQFLSIISSVLFKIRSYLTEECLLPR